MTYEMYRYVFFGSLIASGLFLVASAVLFFTLHIPKVIGDLTGRNARKAIEDIRRQNEQSGDKSYQSSAVNLQRGKLTDKISHSGRLITREKSNFSTGVITEKISTKQLRDNADETTVLGENGETTVLASPMDETTVLDAQAVNETQTFEVEFEITYIHTSEMIG